MNDAKVWKCAGCGIEAIAAEHKPYKETQMGSKTEYEKRKAERNARREHLSDQEARDLDMLDLMDRFVTAFEDIGDGLQKLAYKV